MENKWISVSDRLPDSKGLYIVCYHPCRYEDVSNDICVGTDTFKGKTTWAKNKYQKVLYWMPLPNPPIEEIKKNEWISVEDKPAPYKDGFYRCKGYWMKSGREQEEDNVAYFGEWDIVNNFVLTHWMPMENNSG